MKTTASNITVITALKRVNQSKGYQLEFNRADQSGKWFNFTIKSKSGIPGSRTSASGRNLACASWHAHGFLFDEIFKIEPEAVIISAGQKITAEFGNWQDKNIGSYYPCMYSDTSIL